MRNAWTRREFLGGLAAAAVWADSLEAETVYTGGSAMEELLAGNRRFLAGTMTSLPEDLKILKEKTVDKQQPFAAVLSCADSRVPVEIIFDQTIGHVFVTRVAGNIVTPEITASLEYGVAVLGIKAILVLGHTNCGAVSAAIAAKDVPGQISVLYQHILPAIRNSHGDLQSAVTANVAFQTKLLADSSTVISKAIKQDGLKVAGGVYDLGTGKVTVLSGPD